MDAPERALRFGQFLVSSTKRLADFPEMGRMVPEFGDPSIREIVVRSYRVIYRVDDNERRVDVVRFWHGARGTPEMLEG
jgi:toxin ParE1/3/4